MTFSFSSMIRLIVLLAIGSTVTAIGVSRLDPFQPVRRFSQTIANVNINDFFLNVGDRKSRWIDSDTGTLRVVPVLADDIFEAASCSPWVDDSGHRQVVGRWSNRKWQGTNTVCQGFGLARYSFPDGRLLNQVLSDIYPVGPPCWLPGIGARVLFAAGDGRLYRFAFESDDPSLPTATALATVDQVPLPLSWSCPKPGDAEVFFSDVAWPDDPRLGGRLVVSLRLTERDAAGKRRFSRTQLWWIKLNHSATHIIDAAPLVDHSVSGPLALRFDERSPTVASLPDGSLTLAYTRQTDDNASWQVCLGTLSTDAEHHLLPVAESKIRVLFTGCQPTPLVFSTDRRWLNVLTSGDSGSDGLVSRLPTPSADRSRQTVASLTK